MLEELANGYDDVYACRLNRKGETWFKKWTSKSYYSALKFLTNIPIQEHAGDFRMFSHKAIAALQKLKENERNMKGLFSYIGFKKKPIYYERDPRIAGRTKWNYFKLSDLAVKGLTSFSTMPLRIISIMGCITSVFAIAYMIFVFLKALLYGDPVGGYPSLMSVLLFIGGAILLALGIIGEYLGIIYNETKKRPIYFVNEYSCPKS
jgi:glycosyltransferase involved in cell wall biosynthesis